MTNLQIIAGMMEEHKVTEEVDTYAGWSRRGYQVQKGEKAVFKTKIWKPVQRKEDAPENDRESEGGELEDGKKMILVNAAFFKRSQVAEKEGTGA